jgi:hypothetical protein
VIHDAAPADGGTQVSHVEIIARPTPKSHLGGKGGGTKLDDNGGQGDLVVDVGVGMGGFAIANSNTPDQGMIVQTEHTSAAQIGQISRGVPGVAVPAPVGAAGSVLVFGDVLKQPEMLRGTGPNQGINRVFINNVSAHFSTSDYEAMASKLASNMPKGSTVEVQFTSEPEAGWGKGTKNDRGHVTPDPLLKALAKTGRKVSARMVDVVDDNYTIDAATKPSVDADKAAGIKPPKPQERWIITFDDDPKQTDAPKKTDGDKPTNDQPPADQ